jgi:hypothetical protein
MTLSDELAREAKLQLLKALQTLPDDAPAYDRMRLVSEASRLLERTETKTTQVSRLGDTQTQGAA